MRTFLIISMIVFFIPGIVLAKADWIIGPEPETRGGVANKLDKNHKAIVKITANGVTRTFTFTKGTKGSDIGWWSLGKNMYTHGKISWETTVIDIRTNKVIASNKYTVKKAGEGQYINMCCPFNAKKAKFKMYLKPKRKGPADLYLKEGLKTIGKERLYLMFILQ